MRLIERERPVDGRNTVSPPEWRAQYAELPAEDKHTAARVMARLMGAATPLGSLATPLGSLATPLGSLEGVPNGPEMGGLVERVLVAGIASFANFIAIGAQRLGHRRLEIGEPFYEFRFEALIHTQQIL